MEKSEKGLKLSKNYFEGEGVENNKKKLLSTSRGNGE
jgi:hypothetical protein